MVDKLMTGLFNKRANNTPNFNKAARADRLWRFIFPLSGLESAFSIADVKILLTI
jgi:hypothetical protein